MKIFISHAEKDREIIDKFVDLLFDIGLVKDDIFYSSEPDLGVPNGKNIYDYLGEMFDSELYVLFMLSDNYYSSVACLNEMGAVWIKRTKYITFLLPGFDFQEIKGAIDPRQISIKLDDKIDTVKSRLNMFKEELENDFHCSITQSRWEKKRDAFLEELRTSSKVDFSSNVATYCIGDDFTKGCELFLNTGTKIGTRVDFTKTDSDLCSIVIFPPNENWRNYFDEKRSVVFGISATNVLQNLELEFKFSKRNLQLPLEVGESMREIRIALRDICTKREYWGDVLEICFLVGREAVDTTSTIYVCDFRIE